MSRVLPRKPETGVGKTMLIRPIDPNEHSQFERILPWFTPLFVWNDSEVGHDWVRWSVPKDMAERMGFGQGCACCGKEAQLEGEHADFLIDTMWSEVSFWLLKNGYSLPEKG